MTRHEKWGASAGLVSTLMVLAAPHATAIGSVSSRAQAAPRTATVALLTTQEFRVALVATRSSGATPPTAEVRAGIARRIHGSWREIGELALGKTYFWNTVSSPRAICRLAIEEVGTRRPRGSRLTVQLLISPSVGCGRTYHLPLPTR